MKIKGSDYMKIKEKNLCDSEISFVVLDMDRLGCLLAIETGGGWRG